MKQRRDLSFKMGAGLFMLGIAASSCGEASTPPVGDPMVDAGGGGAGGTSMTASSGSGSSGSSSGSGGTVVCSTPGPLKGDIPCDVFEVLHRECHLCHSDPPTMGAPYVLLSYEDTQATYYEDRKLFQRMNEVIRPGASPRMPFGGMLNDKDLEILGGWLDKCAPPTADGKGCECPGTGCN
jgi:hypothetical protein